VNRFSRRLVLLAATGCIASTAFAGPTTFRLDTKAWPEAPRTVNVAGEFNNWNMHATALADPDGDRVYEATLDLADGEYAYKFVINAGLSSQSWIEDPGADPEFKRPDGHGGFNSVVVVGVSARDLPPAKPDHINLEGVLFNPHDPADLSVDGPLVRVRIRVLADDVQAIFPVASAIVGPNAHSTRTLDPLPLISRERGFDVYGALLSIPGERRRLSFQLVDGNAAAELGLTRKTVARADATDPSMSGIELKQDTTIVTPDWARDANWYQIFPDRFRNSDPANDPGDRGYERLVPWNADWWADAPGETPPAGPTLEQDNFYRGTGDVWNRRYGGDLAGVLEKLPYLRELGVNAIYFNPVFEAESMHKYDTADFRHIDDNFGVHDAPREIPMGRVIDSVQPPVVAGATAGVEHTATRHVIGNRKLYELDGTPMPDGYVETDDPTTWRWTKSDLLFLQFLRDAREQGFRVIVDGVFNHVGRAHPFWKDVLEKGKNSPYADWFEITDWGDPANWKPMDNPYEVHGKPGGIQWRAWDSTNGHLPAFKKSAETGLASGPYEHIMAVTRRWLDPDGNPETRDGIDGWRLDVPNDIPHPFWIDWRKVVKQSNPEGYITGEIWTPAQPWINAGDQFDAVMNYQFATTAQDFFVNQKNAISTTQLNQRLMRLINLYPPAAAAVMQNLFASHDTDRPASMFVNPDRPYDGQNRPQDNAREIGYDARPPTAEEWARYMQMVAFQQTFFGAPMTYYGDEAGMFSPDDPSNRQPFPWDDAGPYTQEGVGFRPEVFANHQRFIAVRNALPALRRGGFEPVSTDDANSVFAFKRTLDDQTVYVVLNRSAETRQTTLRAGAPDALFVDYADAAHVGIEMPMIAIATARPVPVVKDGAGIRSTEGNLSVTLKPWGIAVLVAK
jgi:glycosidase